MRRKNNFFEEKCHYSIRKLAVGAASVLIGLSWMQTNSQTVKADANKASDDNLETEHQAVNNSTNNVSNPKKVVVEAQTSADANKGSEKGSQENADQANSGQETQITAVDSAKPKLTVKTTDLDPENISQSGSQGRKEAEKVSAAALFANNKVQTRATQNAASSNNNPAASTVNESKFKVDDWTFNTDQSTQNITLTGYNGQDKVNIYIPNTYDFKQANKLNEAGKVYLARNLIQTLATNGAKNLYIDKRNSGNSESDDKVYAEGDWTRAFSHDSNDIKADWHQLDVSNLDTSGVTNMWGMFADQNNLTSVGDLSGWDTSKVSSMQYMFSGDNLTGELSLDNWNFTGMSASDGMNGFLSGNDNLTSISAKNWKFGANHGDFANLFANKSNLTSVDISGWQGSQNLTNVGGLFQNDSKLKTITGLDNLKLSSTANTGNMLAGTAITDASSLQGFLRNNPSVDQNGSITNGLVTSYINSLDKNTTTEIDLTGYDTSKFTDFSNMFKDFTKLTTVKLSDVSAATNMSGMFQNCKSLTTIDGIENWDVSKVTNFSNMFQYDDALTKLNLSNWKTSSANNFYAMFANDPKLENVGNLSGWDTSHVNNMHYMFNGDNLTGDLNLDNWDFTGINASDGMGDFLSGNNSLTSISAKDWKFGANHGDFANLFAKKKNLTSVDITGWQGVNNLKNISGLFQNDTSLSTITGLNDLQLGQNVDTTNMLANTGLKSLDSVKDFLANNPSVDQNGNVTASILKDYLKDHKNDTEIDLSNWDLSRVTDYSHMFQGFKNLKKVTLPRITNATNMSAMFDGDTSLTDIVGINDWDVSKVTDFSSMFHGDSSLTSLDLSKWKTPAAKNLKSMFLSDSNLASLNLSGWDVSKVTDMNAMFTYDKKLTHIEGLGNWKADSITEPSQVKMMLYGTGLTNSDDLKQFLKSNPIVDQDGKITEGMLRRYISAHNSDSVIDVSDWDTSRITDFSKMFQNVKANQIKGLEDWDVSSGNNFNAMFKGANSLKELDLSNWKMDSAQNVSEMFSDDTALTSIGDVSNWNVQKVKNFNYMFSSDKKLTTLDLSGWQTKSAETMQDMFQLCINLNQLNLDNWQTDSVTNMYGMFYGTYKLKNIDGLANWHVSNVKDMGWMFFNSGISDLSGLTRWDTSSLTNMDSMFEWAPKNDLVKSDGKHSNITQSEYDEIKDNDGLTSIDLSSWNTSNVKSFMNLFFNRKNLTSVGDLSSWDTSSATNMSSMFAAYEAKTTNNDQPGDIIYQGNLTAIGDLSNWDTSKVTDMSGMFEGQKKLTSVGNFSSWNTDKVTNMSRLFAGCESLNWADPVIKQNLSQWHTDNVTDMSYLFASNKKATDLSFVDIWKTDNVKDMSYMFFQDPNLKKVGNLSGWNTSNVGTASGQNYGFGMMFAGDTNLSDLSGLKDWNTSNLTKARGMFEKTHSLKSIDLSGWDTSNLTIAGEMFEGSGATNINLNGWKFDKLVTYNEYGMDNPTVGKQYHGTYKMFANLQNSATINLQNITLPNDDNQFRIIDFQGNKPIVVLMSGDNTNSVRTALNQGSWSEGTGRQNSDYLTIYAKDNPNKILSKISLNFIFKDQDEFNSYLADQVSKSKIDTLLDNDNIEYHKAKNWDYTADTYSDNSQSFLDYSKTRDPHQAAANVMLLALTPDQVSALTGNNAPIKLVDGKYYLTFKPEEDKVTQTIIYQDQDKGTQVSSSVIDVPTVNGNGNLSAATVNSAIDTDMPDGYIYVSGKWDDNKNLPISSATNKLDPIVVIVKKQNNDHPTVEPVDPTPTPDPDPIPTPEPTPTKPDDKKKPDKKPEDHKKSVPDKHQSTGKTTNVHHAKPKKNKKEVAKKTKKNKGWMTNTGVHSENDRYGRRSKRTETVGVHSNSWKDDQLNNGSNPTSRNGLSNKDERELPATGQEKEQLGILGAAVTALGMLAGLAGAKRRKKEKLIETISK